MKKERQGRNREGWFLREALARLKVSQRSLARKVRMSVAQLNRLCVRTANPTWKLVMRFCKALGCCPGAFTRKGE